MPDSLCLFDLSFHKRKVVMEKNNGKCDDEFWGLILPMEVNTAQKIIEIVFKL